MGRAQQHRRDLLSAACELRVASNKKQRDGLLVVPTRGTWYCRPLDAFASLHVRRIFVAKLAQNLL